MTAIEISGVSKRFTLRDEPVSTVKERMLRVGRRLPTRDFWALDDISLTVNPGETIGLLGHNGSGKSTLLKCVGGILQPTSGDIRTTGRVASLLELGAGFSPDLTGRENVFLNGAILGLSKRELEARLDDIVEFSELEEFIDNPVKTYSSGMHVRLGFAIAINVDPDILLVDEVLAVGDEAFQVRCLERVAQFQQEGRTIVVVTHSAEAVRQVCDRAAVLSRGRLIAEGHPDECIRRFRDSLAQKSAWYENPDAGTEVATSLRDLVTRFAVVDRVAVIGPSGIPDAPVEPGTPITIEIDVRADEPLADVVCSLALFDGGGRPIWGINTDQLQSLGTLEGSSRLRFEIDAVPLRCQQFTLAVTLHSRDQLTTHDVVEHGISVQNGPLSVGIVHLEPRFSIDALAPISEPPSS